MGLLSSLKADFRAIFDRDPAAKSKLEVLIAYPGFHAIVFHRVAHKVYNMGFRVLARFLSHVSRFVTGIEIHPAARIAEGFVIDHGLGVVIGETTEIGKNCLLYQGVTLGGTGKDTGKRHPTLGSNVVVGAGAKVLGPINIGDYSRIGANAVVLKDVPAHCIVVGVPGRVIKRKVSHIGTEGLVHALDHVRMPDPVDERLTLLQEQIDRLKQRLDKLEGKGAKMKIYNTLSGKKEDFVPVREGKVGIYACGVTVYDLCHIGHARSAVVFDVIARYLRYKGFDVKFVRNFTDIDDKIIKRAKDEGLQWYEVASKYIDEYYKDMDRLGIARADVEPKATEHIPEMIEVIKSLIDKGFAYTVKEDEAQSVYFAVSKFKDYGKLSKKRLESLEAGARIDVNEKKQNPMDFVLWKASKEGEPWWDSPWGRGRPGWHIECTAMSMKHLSETIDIHGGGADLVFPHHENEIAQSEAFTGKPFAKYWVHNGFITIDKEKMSKSLGNFFTIREILDKYDAEVIRLFLLTSHYRSPIEFSEDQLREAESLLDRFYSTMMRIDDFLSSSSSKATSECEALKSSITTTKESFELAMDDDFNTALAIGHLFELIREINKCLDSKPSVQSVGATVKEAKDTLISLGQVLNIFRRSANEWNISLLTSKKIPLSEQEILQLITKRLQARKLKDWATADAIRNELLQKGIILEDKKDGSTTWKVKI